MGFVGVCAEGAREPYAVHVAPSPQRKQGQQPQPFSGAQAGQRLTIDTHLYWTEESQLEAGHGASIPRCRLQFLPIRIRLRNASLR